VKFPFSRGLKRLTRRVAKGAGVDGASGFDIAKGARGMRAQHVLSVHDLGLHERHAFGAVQDAAIGFKQALGRIKKGAFKLNGDHPGAPLHAPGCIGHAHIHEGHQGPTVSDLKGVHVRI